MTSQLALMNKNGVAFASDSAVTVQQRGVKKTYNSVRKIHSLAGGQPIGIMIANDASYIPCDVSWERIIKLYSDEIGQGTKPTVQDYITDFIDFVSSNSHLSIGPRNSISIQTDLIQFFTKMLRPKDTSDIVNELRSVNLEDEEGFSDWVKKIEKSTEEKQDKRIDMLHEMYSMLSDAEEDLSEDEHLTKLRITKLHKETINRASEIFCDSFKITARPQKRKVRELMQMQLLAFPSLGDGWRNDFSELVIAGFGEDQLKPELFEIRVGAIVDEIKGAFDVRDRNYIRTQITLDDYGDIERHEDDAGNRLPICSASGFLIPKAQKDEVQNILNGVHDDFCNGYLLNGLDKYILDSLFDSIREKMADTPGIGPSIQEKMGGLFESESDDFKALVKNEIKDAIRLFKTRRRGGFRASTRFMSARQLAEFARKLVGMQAEITYYSESVRSVGGDILAATITKENGFQFLA